MKKQQQNIGLPIQDWCLISLNILTKKCSVFAKKPWHKITECLAIPDQIMLIWLFTLHADNFAGFIMSLLGQ